MSIKLGIQNEPRTSNKSGYKKEAPFSPFLHISEATTICSEFRIIMVETRNTLNHKGTLL
jgi:hypothetical protein